MGAVELGKMRVPLTNMYFIRTVRGNHAFESRSCSVESEGVFTSDLVVLTSWLQDLGGFFFRLFFPSWTLFSYKTLCIAQAQSYSCCIHIRTQLLVYLPHACVLLPTSTIACRGG